MLRKQIPNTITCCNLIAGCLATMQAFEGNYLWALALIVIGAVFDFFDGMSARLLGVSSPIGLQLDSLADDITFGLAPAAVVFSFLQEHADALAHPILPYAAFLIAAFSALRLAKFNIDERQTTSFIGLPTPANALFWASLIAGEGSLLSSSPLLLYGIILLALASCYLLVSELPMFSLKVKHWTLRDNKVRLLFILGCIPLLLWLQVAGPAACIAWYIVLSIFIKP